MARLTSADDVRRWEHVCLQTLSQVLQMDSWDFLLTERCLAAVLQQLREQPLPEAALAGVPPEPSTRDEDPSETEPEPEVPTEEVDPPKFHVPHVPEGCVAILYPPSHNVAFVRISPETTVQQLLTAESQLHGFEWTAVSAYKANGTLWHMTEKIQPGQFAQMCVVPTGRAGDPEYLGFRPHLPGFPSECGQLPFIFEPAAHCLNACHTLMDDGPASRPADSCRSERPVASSCDISESNMSHARYASEGFATASVPHEDTPLSPCPLGTGGLVPEQVLSACPSEVPVPCHRSATSVQHPLSMPALDVEDARPMSGIAPDESCFSTAETGECGPLPFKLPTLEEPLHAPRPLGVAAASSIALPEATEAMNIDAPTVDTRCLEVGFSSPSPLARLDAEGLLRLTCTYPVSKGMLDSMRLQVITSADRKAILEQQGPVWADDELVWHINDLLSNCCSTIPNDPLTGATDLIDPPLFLGWLSAGFADFSQWKAKPGPELRRLVTVAYTSSHWIPVVMIIHEHTLLVHTWDQQDADHTQLNRVFDQLTRFLGLSDWQPIRLFRMFDMRQGCGAMAIAFIAYMLCNRMLPTCPDDVVAFHQALRVRFLAHALLAPVSLKPWLWGNGPVPCEDDCAVEVDDQHGDQNHAIQCVVTADMHAPVTVGRDVVGHRRGDDGPGTMLDGSSRGPPGLPAALTPESDVVPKCQSFASGILPVTFDDPLLPPQGDTANFLMSSSALCAQGSTWLAAGPDYAALGFGECGPLPHIMPTGGEPVQDPLRDGEIIAPGTDACRLSGLNCLDSASSQLIDSAPEPLNQIQVGAPRPALGHLPEVLPLFAGPPDSGEVHATPSLDDIDVMEQAKQLVLLPTTQPMLDLLRMQVTTTDSRLAILANQRLAWADDEILWHMDKLIDSRCGADDAEVLPVTICIDPLLFAGWLRDGFHNFGAWLADQGQGISQLITVAHVSNHWVPLVFCLNDETLYAQTRDCNHDNIVFLEGVVAQIASVLQLQSWQLHHSAWRFSMSDACGAMAIAFLASIMGGVWLPVSAIEVLFIHDALRIQFANHVSSGAVCLEAWLLGHGPALNVEADLAPFLIQQGVPPDQAMTRAKAAVRAIGAQHIAEALGTRIPWKQLKVLGNQVHFQFLLPAELNAKIQATAGQGAIGRPKGGKKSKKVPPEEKPVELDPSKFAFQPGVFQSAGQPLHQILLKAVGPAAEGVAFASTREAAPYLQQGKAVSQLPLALLIPQCSTEKISTALPHTQVTVPCHCVLNQEPMLIDAVLVQIGTGHVEKAACSKLVHIDTIDVGTLKLVVYRDEIDCTWEVFLQGPMKYVVRHFPLLKACHTEDCKCPHWHNH